MTIEARLLAETDEDSLMGSPLAIAVTNHGANDVLILTWETPLEGLLSDCLSVRRDGVEVAYDGPLVKRGTPRVQDYLQLKAGETLRRCFDLSSAYRVSGQATYTVELRSWKSPILDASADLAADPVRHSGLQAPSPKLGSRLELDIENEGLVAPTMGHQARGEEKEWTEKTPPQALGAPKDPTLVGGTDVQRKETKQAHVNGYGLAEAALGGLENNAHYVEWFGVYSATRFAAVKTVYTKITTGMETQTLTYNLTGTGCRPGWYAYTYKGATTVWLCQGFWDAPATGTDSKAGTVVHEWSHALANTDDIAYGQTNCRALAKSDPDDAVKNADSFEYYAGG